MPSAPFCCSVAASAKKNAATSARISATAHGAYAGPRTPQRLSGSWRSCNVRPVAGAARPLFVPVILGTPAEGTDERACRPRSSGRRSQKRPGVETELIDVATLPIPATTPATARRIPTFAETMNRADALVIVAPEYNHGYPGLLKHVLDTNLPEYIHKAAGIVGVSAGIFGGARMIQNLAPGPPRARARHDLLGRERHVGAQPLRRGREPARRVVPPAIEKFLDELVWMAETLRYGRKHVTIGGPREPDMTCPRCGAEMNHQADKLVDPTTREEARDDPAGRGRRRRVRLPAAAAGSTCAEPQRGRELARRERDDLVDEVEPLGAVRDQQDASGRPPPRRRRRRAPPPSLESR